jgi:hypothetical protein
MTSFTTYATTEADVRESTEDALIIPATSRKDAAGKNADVEWTAGTVKSVGVVG